MMAEILKDKNFNVQKRAKAGLLAFKPQKDEIPFEQRV
jgi:hypothetical protein